MQGQEPPYRTSVLWLHLLLITAISLTFESLFIYTGLNLLDEGWILYSAMQLWNGGTLYDDVFFVFPPGHVLPAWIAYGLDPPGIILSRWIYAGFNVALCATIYLLGRRLMRPTFALLGTLLLAIHTPWSHGAHFLFGYRYLVFSILAMLAFARRIDSGRHGWLLLAGIAAGVGLDFRLTPAFAVSVGIATGILASSRDWRDWLRDGTGYALGLLIGAGPVVGWLLLSVGPETLWSEVVVRPVEMTEDQSLALPELLFPWPPSRNELVAALPTWNFRLAPAFYALCLLSAIRKWIRDYRENTPGRHALFIAFVVFGSVYLSRGFGRADQGHLDSAFPPLLLLIGYALCRLADWLSRRMPDLAANSVAVAVGLTMIAFSLFAQRGDQWLTGEAGGFRPFVATGGKVLLGIHAEDRVDPSVALIRRWSRPGDIVLDLSSSPLLLVLAGRRGPGYADIVMPGTFRNEFEELQFLSKLRDKPPALLLQPTSPFDGRPENALEKSAPHFWRWIEANYGRAQRNDFLIARPRKKPTPPRRPSPP